MQSKTSPFTNSLLPCKKSGKLIINLPDLGFKTFVISEIPLGRVTPYSCQCSIDWLDIQ